MKRLTLIIAAAGLMSVGVTQAQEDAASMGELLQRIEQGQARDSQRSFLFHDDADEVGSMALVPLGDKAHIGFLAIGSADTDRFHPGMSIDFLARVGDLVAGALKRY